METSHNEDALFDLPDVPDATSNAADVPSFPLEEPPFDPADDALSSPFGQPAAAAVAGTGAVAGAPFVPSDEEPPFDPFSHPAASAGDSGAAGAWAAVEEQIPPSAEEPPFDPFAIEPPQWDMTRDQLERRAEDILQGLNPQQRAAVEHEGSPLLVVAGAGSGKTSVLTRRIAYLISVRGVAPWNILAITFTNKAAAEMRERVGQLIGPLAERMWVSTFHSMCVRILRSQLGTVTIYDTDDARRLLTTIAKDFDLDPKRYTGRMLASAISTMKNELTTPEQALEEAQLNADGNARHIAEVYGEYQRRLRAAKAYDFDDLINETLALLRNNPDIAAHYRRRFRHILVDEYQDTNHPQYLLISQLVGTAEEPETTGHPAPELCVVGDADQSIYAFRGATIRNIEEFERDYPQATSIVLEQNYRSTQTILDAANAVIGHNSGRHKKELWTDQGAGEKIVGYVADNAQDEAVFISNEIDNFAYNDVAIIYRTNNQSRVLEEIFIRQGIPYRVVGGTRFYERREIRDIIAYLKVVLNPHDDTALRRILNVPKRGIGDKAEGTATLWAQSRGVSLYTALQAVAQGEVPDVAARTRNAIAAFVQLIESLRPRAHHGADEDDPFDLGELVQLVIDESGYADALKKSNDPQDATRLDNVTELVSVAREFATDALLAESYEAMQSSRNREAAADTTAAGNDAGTDSTSPHAELQRAVTDHFVLTPQMEQILDEGVPEPGSLEAFLERVSLVADADELPETGEGVVTLMTLHTAKGLEFPVVFLPGWESGLFPHFRSMEDPTQMEEERRLAYVGITRAKQRLFISRAMVRSTWGEPQANPASQFLNEIPDELIRWEREEPEWGTGWDDDDGWGAGSSYGSSYGSGYGFSYGSGRSGYGSGGSRYSSGYRSGSGSWGSSSGSGAGSWGSGSGGSDSGWGSSSRSGSGGYGARSGSEGSSSRFGSGSGGSRSGRRSYGGGSGVGSSSYGSSSTRRSSNRSSAGTSSWGSGGGAKASSLKLEPGDMVNHDKYGVGKVQEVSRVGKADTVTIDFGSKGTVRLMLLGNVPMEKL